MGQQSHRRPLPRAEPVLAAWSQATPPASLPLRSSRWPRAASERRRRVGGRHPQPGQAPGYFGPLTVHWNGSTWANVQTAAQPGQPWSAWSIQCHGRVYDRQPGCSTRARRAVGTAPQDEARGPTARISDTDELTTAGQNTVARSPPPRQATCASGTYLQTSTASIWDPCAQCTGTAPRGTSSRCRRSTAPSSQARSADVDRPGQRAGGRQQPVRARSSRTGTAPRGPLRPAPQLARSRDHSPLGLRCVGRGVHHRAADPHPALGWHYLDDRVQPQCGQRQPADIGIYQPGAAIVWAAGYSGVSGSFNPLTLQNG